MSRRTRLFRINSPSITERNRVLRQATRYASTVDALCIAMVKTLGSSLKKGEHSLTLTKDEVKLAKTYETLNIKEGPNGEVILTVATDPDVAAQVEAFEAEMNQSATSEVVESEVQA